ncbi:MAG: hypothetical protein AB7T49_12810 [Oligoflexales bacterium]
MKLLKMIMWFVLFAIPAIGQAQSNVSVNIDGATYQCAGGDVDPGYEVLCKCEVYSGSNYLLKLYRINDTGIKLIKDDLVLTSKEDCNAKLSQGVCSKPVAKRFCGCKDYSTSEKLLTLYKITDDSFEEVTTIGAETPEGCLQKVFQTTQCR